MIELYGSHTVFVLGSYAAALAVLVWNLVSAAGGRAAALRQIRERLEEEDDR